MINRRVRNFIRPTNSFRQIRIVRERDLSRDMLQNIRSQQERSIDDRKAKEEAIEKRIERFESFILKKASEENHCSICMDDKAKDVTMIKLTCSHVTCKSCLKKWFLENLNCPNCRHKYNLIGDN